MPENITPIPNFVKALVWWRESAFRAWVKNSLTDLSLGVGAMIGMLTENPDSGRWWIPPVVALGNSAKNFIAAAYDIFWASPNVYEERPIAQPPQAQP